MDAILCLSANKPIFPDPECAHVWSDMIALSLVLLQECAGLFCLIKYTLPYFPTKYANLSMGIKLAERHTKNSLAFFSKVNNHNRNETDNDEALAREGAGPAESARTPVGGEYFSMQ
jgi:hypothetical protein